MSNALTKTEQQDLAKCEAVVTHGIATFHEVGRALCEIRDRRLYRATHATFDAYLRSKTAWGFGRSQAYRLIDAAGVVADLSPNGGQMPANERQTRPLVDLPPEQRREVWQQATADGQPTAGRVAELAAKALEGLPPEQKRERIEAEERQLLADRPAKVHGISDDSEWLGAVRRAISKCKRLLQQRVGTERAIEYQDMSLQEAESCA